MSNTSSPRGYSTLQIALHWIIAALVIFQVIFGEDIVPAFDAYLKGTEPAATDLSAANIHVYVGIAIFVLAVIRLAVRVAQGAPAAPAGESAVQKWIGIATHVVLYGVILGMPISGGIAWFMGAEDFGEIHEIGKPVIIVFVALHTIGALYQHFVVKSDVLMRMLRPERRGAA